MTAKGRAGRRDSGKCWGHWGVRNHYGWWWIRACTPRSYFASRRTWYAVQAPTIAGYGHRRLEPTGTAVVGCAAAAGGSWSARIAMRWPRRWLVSRWNRGCGGCTAASTLCELSGSAVRRPPTGSTVPLARTRTHPDGIASCPRRGPRGHSPRRQRDEGTASARGSAARGGARLGRGGRAGGLIGIARSDFVVRACVARRGRVAAPAEGW